MSWITPITTHADGDDYTFSDLNRVGTDIQYLADLLIGYGYTVTVSPKTDWTRNDVPNVENMTTYLNDLTAIKTKFYGTTTLPSSMSFAFAEQANNIEKLLNEIELYINRMIAGFHKCGTFKSGQGVIF